MRPVHRAPRSLHRRESGAEGLTTLTFRRVLRHPPEVVWQALTDPELIHQWYLTTAKVEPVVGGRVEMVTGPGKVRGGGRVLAWDPPRLFEYEWNTEPDAPHFPGEHSVIRWELTASSEGTRLVLTHRQLRRSTAQVFGRGLPGFLTRLEALLDGRPLPEWAPTVPWPGTRPPDPEL